MVELIMVGLIMSLIVGGIWMTYFNIVNVFYEEQRGSRIQGDGEWIIDLIHTGGHYKGKRIYGLNNAFPGSVVVGQVASTEFDDDDDYRVEFALDETGSNPSPRYAEFAVEFNGDTSPTSKLWFRLRTPDLSGDADLNYDVLLTENLIMRRYDNPQDPDTYGSYNRTWFKADEIHDDTTIPANTYLSGVKISFYLADTDQPLMYNYRLNRMLINPINDEAQRKIYLGGIPFPQFFSTTVYFPNRAD